MYCKKQLINDLNNRNNFKDKWNQSKYSLDSEEVFTDQ